MNSDASDVTMYWVDAFADKPFSGNPAAVCILEEPREDAWMKLVARELNLSETAFLHPLENGWSLRWFTPAVEVQLCGHATLASAHVLWQTGRLPGSSPAVFHTLSGELSAVRVGSHVTMDFPATFAEAADAPSDLARALGTSFSWVGRSRFDFLVELADESAVRKLSPDFKLLAKLPVRGVIVTAPSKTPGVDFVSRFFAPASGVPEDPVTGSAHCALGPFWSERLNKSDLIGYQASDRGGTVHVGLRGQRVILSGSAIIVGRMTLFANPRF
jgi:PhzF family phenazine biosynthesis protein